MSIKLGPIVGSTAHNKAKIWVQTDNPSELECGVYTDAEGSNQVQDSPFSFETTADNGSTGLVTVPLPPPQEDKRYYYRIFERQDGGSLPISQMHSFRSFPTLDNNIESFSFGLVSCNKPKSFDHENELSYRNMWSNLFQEMSSHNAAFILLAGDQVYADHKKFNAWKKSLDSPGSSLKFYRDAYYKHWNFHEMQMVLSNFPSFMIWDDHEITNGWGSSDEHADSRFQEIFQIARKVYEEFQHSHNPAALTYPNAPPGHKSYYYAFRYGPVAFLVLDLRGNREIRDDHGQLLGNEQWQALEHWFESDEAKDSKILFLVSSVPMVHLKKTLAKFLWFLSTDIADQWSAPHIKMERRKLLRILFDKYIENDKRRVFILGGDVHVGTFATITERISGKIIHQFTSSPISNKPARFLDRFLNIFSSKFKFHLDENEEGRERPVDVEISKRYRQRNFGVITVALDSTPKTTFRMYQEYQGQPDEISV